MSGDRGGQASGLSACAAIQKCCSQRVAGHRLLGGNRGLGILQLRRVALHTGNFDRMFDRVPKLNCSEFIKRIVYVCI
jgi:hypothetical protein